MEEVDLDVDAWIRNERSFNDVSARSLQATSSATHDDVHRALYREALFIYVYRASIEAYI